MELRESNLQRLKKRGGNFSFLDLLLPNSFPLFEDLGF